MHEHWFYSKNWLECTPCTKPNRLQMNSYNSISTEVEKKSVSVSTFVCGSNISGMILCYLYKYLGNIR